MMPRTLAAHQRITAELNARRDMDHKAAIDAWLTRWDEPPCDITEAAERHDMTAHDAANEIMCDRH